MGPYTKRIFQRVTALFSAFVLGMLLLVGKLSQIISSKTLVQTAQSQSSYTLNVSKERAVIYDAHFSPLVGTESQWKTAVFPTAENIKPVLDAVSAQRRENVKTLFEGAGTPFVVETEKEVSAEKAYSFLVSKRYSENQTCVHLIGYTDYQGAGVTGLEKGYEAFLSENGREIKVTGVLNALQQAIAGEEPEVQIYGNGKAGLVLTIDKRLQQLVEKIGREKLKKGAIVLIDPYSGQIRAMASFPEYSPLDLSNAVKDDENTPLLNRALLSYSVGSTFKVVTAAAALETLGSSYCLNRKYTCTGIIDVYGQSFRCHLRTGHGELDLFDGMKLSCNPWFIGLGLETGGKAVLLMAEKFGFGQKIQLAEGITVSAGNLPESSSLSSPAAVANLSFGQGELLASPVQIARMMAAVINGGKLVSPSLILGTTEDGTHLLPEAKAVARQVILPETAEQLKAILSYAVMSDDSSGAKPSVTTAGGKTATAQTGRMNKEGVELEHGWFAGYFPADCPQFAAVVLAENEGFGNRSAAPVFAAIADAAAELYGFAAEEKEDLKPGSFTVSEGKKTE